MRHIETIIWILIITLTIGIILWCVFPKKNITESLLVSPIKLYSSNNIKNDSTTSMYAISSG